MSLQLNSENIRKLQEQYQRIAPLPLEQRVVRWLQSSSIAQTESVSASSPSGLVYDSESNLHPQTQAAMAAAAAAAGNYYPGLQSNLSADMQRYLQNSGAQKPSAQATAQMMTDQLSPLNRQTSNPYLPRQVSVDDRNKRPLVRQGTGGSSGMGNGSPLITPMPGKSPQERGKLCCYLKVEVGGLTQMLPIHEHDDPQELAYTFCKDNNILASVESLKEHIRTAIDNYKTK